MAGHVMNVVEEELGERGGGRDTGELELEESGELEERG